jgi:hypothetical protein
VTTSLILPTRLAITFYSNLKTSSIQRPPVGPIPIILPLRYYIYGVEFRVPIVVSEVELRDDGDRVVF